MSHLLLLAFLISTTALAQAPALTCELSLAGPAGIPLVERIGEAYETLLRGNGVPPASLTEYANLAAAADQATLSDFFRFKEAASPEQAVVQDGLHKLKEAVLKKIEAGEISIENAREAFAAVIRRVTGQSSAESVEQNRVDKERVPSNPLQTIRLSANARKAIADMEPFRITGVASHHGQMLAITDSFTAGRIVVLSTKNGKLLLAENTLSRALTHVAKVVRFEFSPTGKYLAVLTNRVDSNRISVWNTATWKRWRKNLPVKTEAETSANFAFSPDDTRLYLATNAHDTVEGFELATGKSFFSATVDKSKKVMPYNIAITPDGLGLAVLSSHQTEPRRRRTKNLYVDVFDAQSGVKTYTTKKIPIGEQNTDRFPETFFAEAFSVGPRGEVVIGHSAKTSIWKLRDREPIPLGEIPASKINRNQPDRRYLLTYNKRDKIKLWDSIRQRVITVKTKQLGDSNYDFMLSSDENHLIAVPIGDQPALAHIWELPKGEYLGARNLGNHDLYLAGITPQAAYFFTEKGAMRALNLKIPEDWK